jgi:hypothetical protein
VSMKHHIFTTILLVFMLSLTVSAVVAQDGDLPDNDIDYPEGTVLSDLSWCFEGQRWGPEVCNHPDNDEWEVAWYWNCGWYWAHYNAGLYDSIPEWCGLIIDSDGDGAVVPPPPAAPALGCYDTKPGYVDMQYFGPINTPGSVHFFSTDDGSCGGGAFFTSAMWVQTNLTVASEVLALCNTIGSGFILARNMQTFYIPVPAVPADVWICF